MKKLFIIFSLFFMAFFVKEVHADNFINIKISSNESKKFHLNSNNGFILYNDVEEINIDFNDIDIYFENGTMVIANNSVFGPLLNGKIKAKEGFIKFNGKNYSGSFYINEKNSQELLNNVLLEDYVKSVVSKEVGSSFELEAIKAQAVAARSYALFYKNRNKNKGYALTSDISHQVYKGVDAIDKKIVDAVNSTSGQVLKFNNEVINAVYSSSNGGVIASAKEVWGAEYPYLISKLDPYSVNTPKVNWEIVISKQDIDQKLFAETKRTGLSSLELEKTELGRVKNILLNYNGVIVKLSSAKFRNLIDNNNFKSTLFDIQFDNANLTQSNIVLGSNGEKNINLFAMNQIFGDSILIKGKGWGHAVGMSQYGANEMAKQGFNYNDILGFYYPNTNLEILND